MDPFSTSVHGSRQPFKTQCKTPLTPPKDVVVTPATDGAAPPQKAPLPLQSSPKRRKPLITYRSPCSQYPVGIFIERQPSNDSSTTESTSPPPPATTTVTLPFSAYPSPSTSSSSPRSSSHSSSIKAPSRPASAKPLTTSSIYALAPQLPLYHPLGALALSLFPLSPNISEEHPTESSIAPPQSDIPQTSSSRSRPPTTRNRSSGRSRKMVAKLRDKTDEDPLVEYTENQKEKEESEATSPRKRRTAASAIITTTPLSPGEPNGTVVATKRRRKEVDDDSVSGSLPPPPKRSRNRTRATSNTPVRDHVHMASPSPSVAVRGQEDDMAVDKDEDPPLNPNPSKTYGRAKRGARTAGGGTRRNGGRRGARKEKEKDKDKDSSVDDDDSHASKPAVQVISVPIEADENTVPVAISIEELESGPQE